MAEQSKIDGLYEKIKKQAEGSGYFLNPDVDFAKDLVEGLIANEDRYGYMLCPCRLSSGDRIGDIDIICPCDYRDADVSEFGACYCALYVNSKIFKGQEKAKSIPERRIPQWEVAPFNEKAKFLYGDAGSVDIYVHERILRKFVLSAKLVKIDLKNFYKWYFC